MQLSIEQTIDRMAKAWDDGDAAAYASHFMPDATYVIFTGSVSEGREAIRRDHEPVLAKWQKGSRMRVSITSVRYIDRNVAVVLTEGGVSKAKNIRLNKVQSFVFRRQESGDWLCESFQNTKKNKLLMWVTAHAKANRG